MSEKLILFTPIPMCFVAFILGWYAKPQPEMDGPYMVVGTPPFSEHCYYLMPVHLLDSELLTPTLAERLPEACEKSLAKRAKN